MTDNPFADVFYIDLANPNRGVFKSPGKRQFRNPKVRAMREAGFGIEKNGSWWHVFNNKLMPGTTDEFKTLREVAANADYYLSLVEKGTA
jgi:hypothetical protein